MKSKYIQIVFFAILIMTANIAFALQIKEPEFVKMKDWKIEKVSEGFIKISSKAQFYNPNKIGVKLINTYADVFLDSQKIGNINQVNTIKVPRQSSFDVPLEVTIRTGDKLDLLLKNALKFFAKKDAVAYYIGFIQIKKAGFSFKVKMNDKFLFNIKDLKLF